MTYSCRAPPERRKLRFSLLPRKMDPSFVAPAPENPALVIRTIPGTQITTFSAPFARGGFLPIGGRSTAVKLANGTVFLVASHALCRTTLEKLRSLGPVETLVAIDLEHNMFIPQYASAYPAAKVYGPDSLVKKWNKSDGPMKGKTHFVYARGEGCDLAQRTDGEIQVVDFGKSFVNEVSLSHSSLAARFVANSSIWQRVDYRFVDAVLTLTIRCRISHSSTSLPRPSSKRISCSTFPQRNKFVPFHLFRTTADHVPMQYSQTKQRSSIPFSSHLSAGSTLQKRLLWHLLGKDRAGMSKNAKLVSAWDFDRIIPCHGDVIETGASSSRLLRVFADVASMQGEKLLGTRPSTGT